MLSDSGEFIIRHPMDNGEELLPQAVRTDGRVSLLFHLDEHLIVISLRPAKVVVAVVHRDGCRHTLEEAFDAREDVGEGFHGGGDGTFGAKCDVVDKAAVVGDGDVRCGVVDCVCGFCDRRRGALVGLAGLVAHGH